MMMGMMMPGGKGGAAASLPVAEDLKELIEDAENKQVRAIKVTIDKKRPRLLLEDQVASTADFSEDFAKVDWGSWLEDATACIVLLRTMDEKGTIAGTSTNTFIFLMFMPEGVPVRQKTGFSSALSSMKTAMPDITFKEWNVSEKEEATCEEAIALAREQTDEERMKTMTPAERASAEHEEQVNALAAEREKTMKRLASLNESFNDSFLDMLDQNKKAVLAKIVAFPDPDHVELSGELLDGIDKADDLKGKLAQDDVLFVVLREDETLLLVHWNPEGAPEDRKIKGSSIIKSLTEQVQEKAKKMDLCFGEACADGDLNEKLGLE